MLRGCPSKETFAAGAKDSQVLLPIALLAHNGLSTGGIGEDRLIKLAKFSLILGLVHSMLNGLAAAQTHETPPLGAYEACSAKLLDGAPDVDKWVFGQFCQSKLANPASLEESSLHCSGKAPRQIEGNTLSRAIEANLPIRLGCAEIKDDMKLVSQFEEQVIVLENSILRDVSLNGEFLSISTESTVARKIELLDAVISLGINLSVEEAQEINIEGVECRDLYINSVSVRDVSLKDTRCDGEVILKDLDSFDHVHLENVTVKDLLSIAFPVGDRLTIDDSTFPLGLEIYEPFIEELELSNVTVAGDFSVLGASRDIDSVWCRATSDAQGQFKWDALPHVKELEAKGVNVVGSLDLSGLVLRTLDLSGAQIRGRLRLWSDDTGSTRLVAFPITRPEEEVRERLNAGWRLNHDAEIDLSYSDIGSIESEYPNSWCTNIGVSPIVNLVGATYDALVFRGSSPPVDSLGPELAAMISAAPRFGSKAYEPGPFAKLALVLDEGGALDAARDVRYGQRVHRHKTRDTTWAIIVDWASWALMGYGIYPFVLLIWFAGLVFLGWALGLSAPALSRLGALDRVWYSLENALPLVSLSEDLARIHHDTWHRHFFHAQKVLGFALATVLVGALSLLGG